MMLRKMPPEMEERVYEWATAGKTCRWIVAEIDRVYDLPVSHTTVLKCIRRLRAEKAAMIELFAETQGAALSQQEQLQRLTTRIGDVAQRALAKNDITTAVRALGRQVELLRLSLEHQRHVDREARLREKGVRADQQPAPTEALPLPLQSAA